jgi:hypothetical protein
MKEEINNIRFLKLNLNNQEWKDFLELIKKDFSVEIICDGNITINYYDSDKLAYSFVIDKDVKIRKKFWVELRKFYLKLLDKLLKDKTFVMLLRKSKDLTLYKNYAYFWDGKTSIHYFYPKERKFKVMKEVSKTQNNNEVVLW